MRRWLGRIFDRRSHERIVSSDLIAFYWQGGQPKRHAIRNINISGAYIETDVHFYVGTMLMVTLQQGEDGDGVDFVTVPCEIVRHGADGVGVRFMLTDKQERMGVRRLVLAAARTSSGGRASSGEAMVEFALIVPLVFLLIVNALNFGGFIYCWLTVADAVRSAADYAALGSNTAGSPITPSVAALTALVQDATAGLPNYSSSNPTVTACIYNNGTTNTFLTTSACPTGVTAPPQDPEPIASGTSTTYSSVAVDVTYTFAPFFAGTSFLQYALPSLPTSIHRRMVVRWP